MKSAKGTTAISKKSKGFTDEERGAIRDRVQEMKAGKGEGESAVLAKIAEMREPDRSMAKRLHTIIRESSPALSPRLWYDMPAYAKDDKVVCFFQAAAKFKTRHATFGFSDKANLDEGAIRPRLTVFLGGCQPFRRATVELSAGGFFRPLLTSRRPLVA